MKTLALLWAWICRWLGHASRDERLMALCYDAQANGWRFARGVEGFGVEACGCPMQAVGWLQGGVPWGTVAEKEFDVGRPAAWGIGFDHALAGVALDDPGTDDDYAFGARIARRLKTEGLA